MSGRDGRHDTEESHPAAVMYQEDSLLDLLSKEGREHLERFAEEDQRLFAELIEDANSELQQEFLRRALAARHTIQELHAFGDSIRGMSDEQLYDACTLLELSATGVRRSVVQRMRAEADPIYGYTLNGHSLTDEDASGFDSLGLPSRPRPNFAPAGALLGNPASGELESSIARGKKISARELGESGDEVSVPRGKRLPAVDLGDEPSVVGARKAGPRELGASLEAAPSYAMNRPKPPAPPSAGDDVFTAAVRQLGYAYAERRIDPGNFPLAKAVEAMILALRRGLPVPAVLSNLNGSQRRYVLFLQANATPKGHALQVHEPQSDDTVWVNDADLKSGGELPLMNKALRRLTAVVLPRMKGTT